MIPDEMKQLTRELGHAINDAVAESDRVREIVAKARAFGLDVALQLDGTVRITRFVSSDSTGRFLQSMHLAVEFDNRSEP